MTYALIGDEFAAECEAVGLSDAAHRLHVTMLAWQVGALRDGVIGPSDIRRALPGDYSEAVDELVAVKFWQKTKTGWQIVHHLNRQVDSTTLTHRRETGAERQRRKRQKDAASAAQRVASVSAGFRTEPNPAEPNQRHAHRHNVSHGVTDQDPWQLAAPDELDEEATR